MIGIIILIILAVSGLVTYAYYTDQELVTNSVSNILDYKPEIECNIAGDCVEFFVPLVPENTNPENHETVPVNYDTDDLQDGKYYENGTQIPTSSYITGNINDISYSRQGIQNTEYNAIGEVMRVQIGNIASIEGQIKIIDPITKELVEPRTAKYVLTIDCSELTEFCNLDPVVKRGTTTTAGTFIEKWTTSTSQNTVGLYEVTVFATSETKDMFDRYYDVSNVLFLELYK